MATLHDRFRATVVRSEIVAQICAVYGPTEAARAELDRALVTAADASGLRNSVCRLIARHWGQEVMFQALRSHPELRTLGWLQLAEIPELTECPSGAEFPELVELSLCGCTGLSGPEILGRLQGMINLGVLLLDDCRELTQAPSGADCPSLGNLSMDGCTGLKGPDSLRPLAGMTKLQYLYIRGCTGLEGVDVPALMKELGLTCNVFGPKPEEAHIHPQGSPF